MFSRPSIPRQTAASIPHQRRITPAIATICGRLDGVPSGHRSSLRRGFQSRSLLPECSLTVDNRFRLFKRSSKGAGAIAHQTLSATVAPSYDLLTPAGPRLLASLSVFSRSSTSTRAEEYSAVVSMIRTPIFFELRERPGREVDR